MYIKENDIYKGRIHAQQSDRWLVRGRGFLTVQFKGKTTIRDPATIIYLSIYILIYEV